MTGMTRSIVALMLLVATSPAMAHGIHAHIHVTGWAIEALPDGELRDFFSEPEVMNAALFGAAFTDSGYWPLSGGMGEIARAYSEHTHWEPFIQDVVTWIRTNDPPPWDSLESRKRAAFFMGCASHGMQDELFDSLFLHQVEHHDGSDQDGADPASDGFLILDGHLRFYPEPYFPLETLLTLYSGLEVEGTEEVIQAAVDKMVGVYVNDGFGPQLAEGIGESSRESLPWTYDHYMEESIPGSLRSEIAPTMGYLQAIWARLHGTFDPNDVVVATYPGPTFRLLGVASGLPDSWVTFVYGAGVHRDGPSHLWVDASGAGVPFERHGTRWGQTWTRLHSLRPSSDLPHTTWMSVTLPSASQLIDEALTTAAINHTFETPCAEPDDPYCDTPPMPPSESDAGSSEESDAVDAESEEVPDGTETSLAPARSGSAPSGCTAGGAPVPWLLLSLLACPWLRRRSSTTPSR